MLRLTECEFEGDKLAPQIIVNPDMRKSYRSKDVLE